MNGYLAVIKGRLAVLLRYRAAALAGVLTQAFWGVINTMILQAFYEHAAAQPLSLDQALTFIWLGQAFLLLIPWSIDKELEAQVRNGNVAYELVRPMDLYWLWYARSLAMRVTPTLLRCGFVLLVGIFFGLKAPASPLAGFVFAFSLLLSAILSTAMTALVVIGLLWTIAGDGIQRLMPHLTVFLTGMVVPLPLFPDWMQAFLDIQPFRGILDIPIRLYTGLIPLSQAGYYLGFQLLWTVLFIGLGRWLMHKAMRRLVIQGG
jgi:ABC-2 type transport system permease protein